MADLLMHNHTQVFDAFKIKGLGFRHETCALIHEIVYML